MGLTKINQILKKYKALHKQHVDSWNDASKRIARDYRLYQMESYNHQLKGNKILNDLMRELEGQEIFPKRVGKNLK